MLHWFTRRGPWRCLLIAWCGALLVARAEDATTNTVASTDYKISPQDVLLIDIVGETTLGREYRVAAEGEIYFPFIQNVKVAGRTAAEASAHIKDRLINEDYFVDPQVIINVKDYQQRMINVFGEVNRPGQYPLPGERRMDIVDAISMAGGPSKLANKKSIRVTRAGQTKTYSLDELMKIQDPAKKFWLEANDVIEVPQSFL